MDVTHFELEAFVASELGLERVILHECSVVKRAVYNWSLGKIAFTN